MARVDSSTVDGRLGRIEEAILNLKDDRVQSREDRADIIRRIDGTNEKIEGLRGAVAGLTQTVHSTAAAISQLSLEKCGERLDKHDDRLSALENKTKGLPLIETEIMFWRRVLGGGFKAAWKIAAVIIGSGAVGGGIVKLLS